MKIAEVSRAPGAPKTSAHANIETTPRAAKTVQIKKTTVKHLVNVRQPDAAMINAITVRMQNKLLLHELTLMYKQVLNLLTKVLMVFSFFLPLVLIKIN